MQSILDPKSIPGLEGKSVKKTWVQPGIILVPQHIQDYYQEIILLAIDIVHVNKIPFPVIISRHIHYHMATAMKEMTTQVNGWDNTALYQKREFHVKEILANGQFYSSRIALADSQINLNCVSTDEHDPEAERLILTPKERCRCSLHNTPFPKLPKQKVMFTLMLSLIKTASMI